VIENAFSSKTSDFNNDHPVISVIEDSFSSNTATSDFNNDHPVIFVIEDGEMKQGDIRKFIRPRPAVGST